MKKEKVGGARLKTVVALRNLAQGPNLRPTGLCLCIHGGAIEHGGCDNQNVRTNSQSSPCPNPRRGFILFEFISHVFIHNS